jgi:hypothetical protein
MEDDENFRRFETLTRRSLGATPGRLAAGAVLIEWEDLGDDQEPNFRFSFRTEPPLSRADRVRMAKLFRLIAQMKEADLNVEWPEDQSDDAAP